MGRNETSLCLLNTVARRRLNDLAIHKRHILRVVSISYAKLLHLTETCQRMDLGEEAKVSTLKAHLFHSEGGVMPEQCHCPPLCHTPEPPWQAPGCCSVLRSPLLSETLDVARDRAQSDALAF